LTLGGLLAHKSARGRTPMTRFATFLALLLTLAASLAFAGCSGSGLSLGGLTTGAVAANKSPSGLTESDPMARPFSVAWTSARAQRCGFYFDPGKLKAAYLAYESSHNAAGELPKFEKAYEKTYEATAGEVNKNADYCTDKKASEIKADLQRYLAGDYTPHLPKAQAAQCGGLFDPCISGKADGPFDPDAFWKKQEHDNNMNAGH
jgi:hypothetical protein